jgi:D-threonate/D-erythronate kinase
MTRSARWAIVADDLSGAADAGAGFLRAGHSVVVGWDDPGDLFDSLPAVGVVAFDTASRRGSPERARSLTFAAVETGRARGASRLFKKVDSTLRGHIGAEVDGARDAWDPTALVIVAPAFPALGRTTREGRQFVHHEPVGRPPLKALLEESGLRTSTISLDHVRGPELAALMAARRESGDAAIVCDAETAVDLSTIVQAGAGQREPVIWVGSAGLARELAASPFGAPHDSAESLFAAPVAQGPVLIVVGSASDVSRRQASVVASRGAILVNVTAADLDPARPADAIVALKRRIMLHLEQDRDVVVALDGEPGKDDEQLVARLGLLLKPAAAAVGGVIVTGGETAMHLFRSWGVTGLRLADEIEPGVPRSWTLGKLGVPAVTKAGGFGDDMSLERARRRLRGAEEAVVRADEETVWPSR